MNIKNNCNDINNDDISDITNKMITTTIKIIIFTTALTYYDYNKIVLT